MQSKGKFIYKSLLKREGGTFTNEKGQNVNYNEAYILKCDEFVDGQIYERKFRFPSTNTSLYNKFNNIQAYTPLLITFDVILGDNRVSLTPVDIEKAENK